MPHDFTDSSDQRRKLEVQASSAHDLMLAVMDFAAAQARAPHSDSGQRADFGACQACSNESPRCVRGFYVMGLRGGCDDETEIARLRRQGCLVQVVEAERLEAFAPHLLDAIRREKASG